jgi:hypothetical protein
MFFIISHIAYHLGSSKQSNDNFSIIIHTAQCYKISNSGKREEEEEEEITGNEDRRILKP